MSLALEAQKIKPKQIWLDASCYTAYFPYKSADSQRKCNISLFLRIP